MAENNLGIALASSSPGRLREAAAHFAAALRIDPRFVQARNNLDRAQRLLEQMPATQP